MSEAEAIQPRQLPYVAAITEGVRQVLAEQQDAFLAGEDVAQAGGVYGYFTGLLKEFGEDRVVDTPISEKGIVGLAVGAAATGLVLTSAGAGLNLAAQHSQSLEAWLAHLPGLKVIMPTTAYDAKGAIIAASRDDNPVFVVFNKASLGMMGEVPEEPYKIPIGVANIVRPGTNFTIVAIGRMVHEALQAAETLKEVGLDVEVIDARSIQPFDTDTVVESIKKTHRALIVHEAVRFGGIGGEIAAQIQELAFDYLDAPVARVGAPFSPVPFSPALEQAYVPNALSIVTEAKRILGL
jgi:pyruvate dehydrogenase E1 component beta subunit